MGSFFHEHFGHSHVSDGQIDVLPLLALGQKRRLRGLAIKARWRRTTAFDIGISTDFNVRFRLRLRFVDVRFAPNSGHVQCS